MFAENASKVHSWRLSRTRMFWVDAWSSSDWSHNDCFLAERSIPLDQRNENILSPNFVRRRVRTHSCVDGGKCTCWRFSHSGNWSCLTVRWL